MSELKATPGPWYSAKGKGDSRRFIMRDGKRLATTHLCRGQFSAKANAHLIAAAPEMYEALMALQDDGDWRDGLWVPSKESVDKADAALKKARGEA